MIHVKEKISTYSDTSINFDISNDNKVLIEAFKTIGIALRDENGEYRNTCDVLKDMYGWYEL